ncbi:hypothetical protein C8J57DRAFT_1716624 [Mycena rebaudengoi]|nr:hypothetical protein C8J57DRAFT_1716624 [Mycena rebaudengoi]
MSDSSSVALLRARVANVSSTIVSQKKALEDLDRVVNDLETTKSDLQRQLNTLLDPLARLPLEISSEIFLLCLPEDCRCPNTSHAPMLLLNICGIWRDIALSTPSLWSALHVEFPRTPGFRHLFECWLDRAGTRPLSIALNGKPSKKFANLLCPHAHRVQSLEMRIDRDERLPAAAAFTMLKTLKLVNIGKYNDDFGITPLLDMLHSAPGLVECTLIDIYPPDASEQEVMRVVTLPSLRCLRLGGLKPTQFSSASVLCHLALPALQTLVIPDIDIIEHEAISFLVRSSPPLQSLVLGAGDLGEWTPYAIARFFALMPAVTDLRLWDLDEDTWPTELLPSDYWAEKTYTTLSARSQLASARIVLFDESMPPEPGILDPMRELAAKCGMEIYFGTEEMNFI